MEQQCYDKQQQQQSTCISNIETHVSLWVSFFFFLSLSFDLCLSLSTSPFLFVFVFLCISPSLPQCVSLCLYMSSSLCPLFLSRDLSLSLSLYIYLLVTFLSIYLNIYLSNSTYISISHFNLSH
jgi:hypothetical protein